MTEQERKTERERERVKTNCCLRRGSRVDPRS